MLLCLSRVGGNNPSVVLSRCFLVTSPFFYTEPAGVGRRSSDGRGDERPAHGRGLGAATVTCFSGEIHGQIDVPSGNQTWQWKSTMNGGFSGKITYK